MKAIFREASIKSVRAWAALVVAAALALSAFTGCAAGDASGSNSQAQTASSSAAASSSQNSSASAQADATETASVKVVGPDEEVLAERDVEVLEGDTALSALLGADLAVATEDSEYGKFVTSIDGIENEGSNGWMYAVNGESPSVSAGDYEIAAGDEVVWTYYQA